MTLLGYAQGGSWELSHKPVALVSPPGGHAGADGNATSQQLVALWDSLQEQLLVVANSLLFLLPFLPYLKLQTVYRCAASQRN